MVESNKNIIDQNILLKRKVNFEKLMSTRYYYSLGSEIYGGVAGLYDWGPPGCAIRKNVQNSWRDHFILEEDMLEISTTNITPESVFLASGHVKRFTDLLVKDSKTKFGYRADKLLAEWIQNKLTKDEKKLKEDEKKQLIDILSKAEIYNKKEIGDVFKQLNIKAPDTGNDLDDPEPFNLMFQVQIGPSGQQVGYLRPETAQGMFVNFQKLQNYVNGKLPFAVAQIGLGFRNEIAPKGQLLRVREFDLAEIEHFFDPEDPSHPKYQSVKHLELPLLNADKQESDPEAQASMQKLQDAVDQGIICNQTMAYFLCRTYQFLVDVGINSDNIRFRQHRKKEMAHYACDCWDAEVQTSNGWIEMVGHANRSAYDLESHSTASGKSLVAARILKEPKQVTITDLELNKQLIGKTFKAKQKQVVDYLENLQDSEKIQLNETLQAQNEVEITLEQDSFKVTKDMIKSVTQKSKMMTEEKFTPFVIEPAFGLGRIISAILEHNFRARDEQRTYVKLPPKIAPYKCSLLPVMPTEESKVYIQNLKKSLVKSSISVKIDESNVNIGKRYARTDELGIPFAITIDNDTFTDQTVTLREIETMIQVRIKVSEVTKIVWELSEGFLTWDEVLKTYPLFVPKSE